jgi:hypothetical protein
MPLREPASQSRKLPEPAGRQHAAACADPDGLWHWPARHRAARLVTLTLVGIRSASRPMRPFRTQSGCIPRGVRQMLAASSPAVHRAGERRIGGDRPELAPSTGPADTHLENAPRTAG